MRRLEAHRTWLLYAGVVALARTTGWTLAAVYFVQEVGMGPLELVLAGTALELAYLVFEVPTGIVADVYSRRASVVVGQLIMGAAFILTGAIADVGVVLAAAALLGFGWTFRSGAEDAWLADEVGPDMPETGFRPATREGVGAARSFARTAHQGGRLIRARPVLLLIVAISFFGGMWSEALDRLWEAHFLLDIGLPGFAGFNSIVWFGVLAAGSLLLSLAVAQPLTNLGDSTGQWAGGPVLGAIGSVVSIGAALATGALVLTWRCGCTAGRSGSAGPRRSLV